MLQKREKVLLLKTFQGRTLRIVREHYLRPSVPCNSPLCPQPASCQNGQGPAGARAVGAGRELGRQDGFGRASALRLKGAAQRRSAGPRWRGVRGPRASSRLQAYPRAGLRVGHEGPEASGLSTPTPDCSAPENGRAERPAPSPRRGRGLGLSEPGGAGAGRLLLPSSRW